MQFVRGGELLYHMQLTGTFLEARAKRCVLQLALALGHLHSKNIIYRDLKPENVLVAEDGYLALIDFGISKRLVEEEVAHSYCGTPEYLAPEMVLRTGHSYSLDWWGLGTLAYELLAGFPPFFSGDNREKLMKKICTKDVFFPNEKAHGIKMS